MLKQNHQNDQQYTIEYKKLAPQLYTNGGCIVSSTRPKVAWPLGIPKQFYSIKYRAKIVPPSPSSSSSSLLQLFHRFVGEFSPHLLKWCRKSILCNHSALFFSCGVLLPLLLPLELMLWSWTRYWSSDCGCSAMGWCSFVTSREYSPDEPQPERPERPPLNWHGQQSLGQARNFLTNNLLVNWGFHVERWGPKDMLGTVGERVVGVCGIVTGIDAKCGRHLIFY